MNTHDRERLRQYAEQVMEGLCEPERWTITVSDDAWLFLRINDTVWITGRPWASDGDLLVEWEPHVTEGDDRERHIHEEWKVRTLIGAGASRGSDQDMATLWIAADRLMSESNRYEDEQAKLTRSRAVLSTIMEGIDAKTYRYDPGNEYEEPDVVLYRRPMGIELSLAAHPNPDIDQVYIRGYVPAGLAAEIAKTVAKTVAEWTA